VNKPISMKVTTESDLNIILVRAGATELDAQGRITGALDVPMCVEAEAHIERTAAQLSFFSIDVVYTADCDSARQTAKILSGKRKVKIKVSPVLSNLDCGLWHGKRIEEVKQTQPRLFRKWAEMTDGVCPPDGETLADARERVEQFLTRIRKKHASGTIVIVAPQPLLSVIRGCLDPGAAAEPWTTIPESGKWEAFTVSNGGVDSSAQSLTKSRKIELQTG
jgi:broad specificity phosphatase PhoE